VGNTKIVADRISELTGAVQFEIKTSNMMAWPINRSSNCHAGEAE
jgi:flavodoxin